MNVISTGTELSVLVYHFLIVYVRLRVGIMNCNTILFRCACVGHGENVEIVNWRWNIWGSSNLKKIQCISHKDDCSFWMSLAMVLYYCFLCFDFSHSSSFKVKYQNLEDF